MKKVEIISPTRLQTNQNCVINVLRVCAYCRVSTDYEDQINSYKSQIKYYTAKIKENPEWEFVRIYADEGISGIQAYNRTEFQQMIKDAMDGKIDLILVKSISRFGRNTVDILHYIRKLKAIGVAIYFEEEHINTLQMQGEILISVLAALAQQGSSTISSSVILGNQMKMKRGDYVGRYDCYGYRYNEDTELLEIVEEEAKIVRKVFKMYAEGKGSPTIAKEMNKAGVLTPEGKKWRDTTVLDMIKNEKYAGDLVQGKNYTVDPIAHIRKENHGEKELYKVTEKHEGIVDRATYNKTQSLLAKRSKKYNGEYQPGKYSQQYTFSSKIVCGYCGQTYNRWKRKVGQGKKEHDIVTWVCSTKKQSKQGRTKICENYNYREETIEKAFIKAYSLLCENNKEIIKKMLNIVETLLSGNYHDDEIKKLKNQLANLKDKETRLVDMKLENLIDEKLYKEKYSDIMNKIGLLENKINEYENIKIDEELVKSRIERFKTIFKSKKIFEEFSKDTFNAIVDKVIIGRIEEDGTKNPDFIKFVLNTGSEIVDTIPPQKGRKKKKTDTTLSDHEVAQNSVSFTGDRKWYARNSPYAC